jgi:hypothetical protein
VDLASVIDYRVEHRFQIGVGVGALLHVISNLYHHSVWALHGNRLATTHRPPVENSTWDLVVKVMHMTPFPH